MRDARAMTPATQPLPRTRRAYDHRFREQVARFGAKVVARQVQIPRSTASTWRRRGLRPVVTTEQFEQEKPHPLDSTVRGRSGRERSPLLFGFSWRCIVGGQAMIATF